MDREQKVDSFKDACLKAGLKEIGTHVFELKQSSEKTLALCTLVHGNEIGGIETFLFLLNEIETGKLKPKLNLRIILGNIEAYYEDKRFLEKDMNRSFGLDEPISPEELRAKELETFLSTSDFLIDVHQTIGPTYTPFYIFEYDEKSYDFARYLHATLPIVTYTMERRFKGKTSTGFMIDLGKSGITIETGQKGIDKNQISLGYEVLRKAIESDLIIPVSDTVFSKTFTFAHIIDNPHGTIELVKTLQNFESIKKDELLAKGPDSEYFSPVDGVILFPKYGAYARSSPELALILKPVHKKQDL